MATQIVEIFGLQDLSFITAGATPTYTDIKGAQKAELTLSFETEENRGDDDIISYWLHSQKAEVEVVHGVVDLDTIAKITGNTVTTTGSGPTQVDKIPFGTEAELTPTYFLLRATTQAKLSDGTAKKFYIYMYKVQSLGFKIEGLADKTKGAISFKGLLLRSTTDETNATITPARGRLEVGPVS